MAPYWVFLFGEEDEIHVEEIAKIHKIPVEIVKKHYEAMLEAMRNELQA
jgi:DNA-directed RNA polymerase specialized sigma24 family protein